jgi:D-serine deaminase-like pyridoxal phosphate-dependent protein
MMSGGCACRDVLGMLAYACMQHILSVICRVRLAATCSSAAKLHSAAVCNGGPLVATLSLWQTNFVCGTAGGYVSAYQTKLQGLKLLLQHHGILSFSAAA